MWHLNLLCSFEIWLVNSTYAIVLYLCWQIRPFEHQSSASTKFCSRTLFVMQKAWIVFSMKLAFFYICKWNTSLAPLAIFMIVVFIGTISCDIEMSANPCIGGGTRCKSWWKFTTERLYIATSSQWSLGEFAECRIFDNPTKKSLKNERETCFCVANELKSVFM